MVGLTAGHDEPPGGIQAYQMVEHAQKRVGALVPREPPETEDRLARRRRRGSQEFALVDAVFDECQTPPRIVAKHVRVALAAGDDTVIRCYRRTGQRLEPQLLGALEGARVEEAAMSGSDQAAPVQRASQGQKVEEEIDGVDVDHIRVLQVAQHAGRQWIAAGSGPRNPPHRHALDDVPRRQNARPREQPVERQNAGIDIEPLPLCPAEAEHGVLQSADRWAELADNMDNLHADTLTSRIAC